MPRFPSHRLLGCAALLCSMAICAAPQAVFDRLEQDFGQVEQGALVSQTFRLRNAGDSPLRIEQVKFSMPGMRIRTRQELAPGESAEVKVEWDTRGYNLAVEGQTLLLLNDPKQPRVVLTSSGEIRAPLEILPRPALYLSQYRDEPATSSLEIRSNRNEPLQIGRIEPKGSHFQASLETLEEGKRYKLLVQGKDGAEPGRYREALVLHTNDPAHPQVHIEVNTLIKADVHVSQESVDFGHLSLAELQRQPDKLELTRQTLIVSNRSDSMHITGLKSDLGGLTLSPMPDAAAQAFKIDVGLDLANLRPGPLDGVIELHTDNPEMVHLSIPVTGQILP